MLEARVTRLESLPLWGAILHGLEENSIPKGTTNLDLCQVSDKQPSKLNFRKPNGRGFHASTPSQLFRKHEKKMILI